MKPHEHKYIAGTIGDECGFCGLLKSTIERTEMPCDPNQVWEEALTPMIQELPEVKDRFPERLEELIVDKINELVKAVNKLQRP
jgi:hypothetical protein